MLSTRSLLALFFNESSFNVPVCVMLPFAKVISLQEDDVIHVKHFVQQMLNKQQMASLSSSLLLAVN